MSEGHGLIVRMATRSDLGAARAVMIRTFEEDFGTGYVAAYHADVDDLAGWYLEPPRRALFVAVDERDGNVVATGAVRGGALKGGPPELVARYDDEHTAQLVRIYTLREHRRRGAAREIVRAALAFILADPHYTTIALHTYPHSPGALPFWERLATRIATHDDPRQPTAYFFEIARDRARTFVDRGV